MASDYSSEARVAVVAEQLAKLLPPYESLGAAIQRQIEIEFGKIRDALAHPAREREADGWLDSKAAAKYMGISRTTFDKYRYETQPRLKGYPLDGKVLYKKSDIDSFVRLYALKNEGLP